MRPPILSFPAKRANRAMLTSTMRLVFETTIERRRNRASQCRWRALSRSILRLLLARIELPNRQQHAIDGVIVRTVQAGAPARQPLEQALTGGLVTIPAFPVHQLACSTIPSLPDPERFGLFFRECHISSSSITTARPSGSGFWA